MKLNDYVYHSIFGFGVITRLASETCDIYFYEQNVKTIRIENKKRPFFQVISDVTKSLIKRQAYKSMFGDLVMNRAKAYQGEVKISYDDEMDIFTGVLTDKEEYTVKIERVENDFMTICSCPTGFRCVHGAIVLEEIFKIFASLKSHEVTAIESKSNLIDPYMPEELKNLTIQFSRYPGNQYSLLKKIVHLIGESNDPDFIQAYFTWIYKNFYNYSCFRRLFQAIFLYVKTADKAASIVEYNNHYAFGSILSNAYNSDYAVYQMMRNNRPHNNKTYLILYYYYNDLLDLCLKEILDNGNDLFLYSDILEDIIMKEKMTDLRSSILKEYLKRPDANPKIKDMASKNLTESDRKEIYLKNNANVPLEDLPLFTIDQQIKMIANTTISDDIVEYAMTNIAPYVTDENCREFAKYMYQAYDETYSRKIKQDIIDAAKKMPNSKYLVLYFENLGFTYRAKGGNY